MDVIDPRKQLAGALGRIASGLFVLTLQRGNLATGMLASWVQQCSFEPPMVTVAIRSDREVLTLLGDGDSFLLNVLENSQTDMIVHFGRGFSLEERPFEGLEVRHVEGFGSVLSEALAYLACRVVSRQQVGDHVVVTSVVLGGRLLSEGQPMVHVRKSGFHY